MSDGPGGSQEERSGPDPAHPAEPHRTGTSGTADPTDTRAMVEEHEREAQEEDHVGLVGGPSHLGVPGPPLDRRAPFYLGFFGGLGALTAWWLGTTILAIGSTLLLIVVALFLGLVISADDV